MERFTLKIIDKPKSSLRNVCRLCGMDNPNKVFILRDEDVFCEDDVPLSTKIQVCCGIEVTKKDRMPQKICTLCSDKINDFYEFREMCTATNVQTRDLLGLPREKPKSKAQPSPPPQPPAVNNVERRDAPSKTILQPPIISESKTMRDTRGRPPKVAKKKAPGKVVKPTKSGKVAQATRQAKLMRAAKIVNLKQEPKDPPPPPAAPSKPTMVDIKPLLRPAVVKLTNILPLPPIASISQPKSAPAPVKPKLKKKVQFSPALPVVMKRPIVEKEPEKPQPKKARVEKPPRPPVLVKCPICIESIEKDIYSVHMMQVHTPKTYEYGCSPCGVPFENVTDYRDHQNWHKNARIPFRCFKCLRTFDKLAGFTMHSQKFCPENHVFTNTVPNTNCTMCGQEFATFNLYNWHGCFIKSNTNCPKCDRFIQRKDRLFRHIFVCKGKGTSNTPTPDVSDDADSLKAEHLGAPVPKVKPLKIKIHKKKFATVTSTPRTETVIKTEPDSTLEIEESQINVEGASLHTSYDDIQPPKPKPKSPKALKRVTLKNPYAQLARRIKQEPKDPTEVATQPAAPRVSAPVAARPTIRVKQEPVDSGYEKMVRIAAKNIKKERIDTSEEPPQQEDPEEETQQEEDPEEEEEAAPEEPPPVPPLPRGVRIKQEKPDVIVKPEPIDPAYDKHLPPKPPAKIQKVAKKRVFKIPTALIQKLQQEKKKQQEKETRGEGQNSHGETAERDDQGQEKQGNKEQPEAAPEAAPQQQAPVPVITGVRSIEKSDFRAPFVPVRIKTERVSPTRTLQRDVSTAQEENRVNGSSENGEEDQEGAADEESAATEESAANEEPAAADESAAGEEMASEAPKEAPENNAEAAEADEMNLSESAPIPTNDQNGVVHEIPRSIDEPESAQTGQN